MKTLNELFADLIFQNEVGDTSLILKLSDPDGIRSGKSGWSFGKCQFDTKNNSNALRCLRECGCTEDEITGVVNQTVDPHIINAILQVHPDIVERYDEAQLGYCLNKAVAFVTDYGIPVESPGGILAGADYCNQYGSEGNGAVAYYRSLGRPVEAEDVLEFKLHHTLYGAKFPKDCKRRYDNLVRILKESI